MSKAIVKARAAILEATARRNCEIAGVPYDPERYDEFDMHIADLHARVGVGAFLEAVPAQKLVAALEKRSGQTYAEDARAILTALRAEVGDEQ